MHEIDIICPTHLKRNKGNNETLILGSWIIFVSKNVNINSSLVRGTLSQTEVIQVNFCLLSTFLELFPVCMTNCCLLIFIYYIALECQLCKGCKRQQQRTHHIYHDKMMIYPCLGAHTHNNTSRITRKNRVIFCGRHAKYLWLEGGTRERKSTFSI